MAVINCENLSLGYEGKNIINNISFSLSKGDYLCIVGENGSGKTTLMKGLLGFIKPYSGTITLDKSKIGYLPQQTGIQKDFPVTVNEVILSGCLAKHNINPFYTRKDKELANAMAQKLELESIKDKCYQELSGGQQQRVLIARALCAAENLLVLDEPAAGLDPIITNEIYEIIKSLNAEDHMTVVMVSHDINAALKYASHILHIDNDYTFFGTVKEYVANHVSGRLTGGVGNE